MGYVAWYGFGRTYLEGLRMDSLMLGNFRISQLLAAGSCVIAVIFLIVMAFVKPDRSNLYANVIAAKEQETIQKEAEESEQEEA